MISVVGRCLPIAWIACVRGAGCHKGEVCRSLLADVHIYLFRFGGEIVGRTE